MQISKSILLFIFAALFLMTNNMSMGSAPAKSTGEASYKNLIKMPINNEKAKKLELLGALLLEHTVDRVMAVLNLTRGKNSNAYKDANIFANEFRKTTADITHQNKPNDVNEAYKWIIKEVSKSREAGTEAQINRYKREKEIIPDDELKTLLDNELAYLDSKYKVTVATLKTSGTTTNLPTSLDLIAFMYRNVLK